MAKDTRRRLLDAAEHLLAQHGASRTSVRDVLSTAGVSNAAAVGYYFGNKDALVAAVERRVVDEVNERRRAGLRRLGPDATVEGVVEAWARPLVELRCAGRGPAAAAVFTRIFEAEESQWEANGVADVMAVGRLYREASARLLGRDDDDVEYWRWTAMTAVLATYATGELERDHRAPTPADVEHDLARLVAALVALLLAPLPERGLTGGSGPAAPGRPRTR